MKDTFVGIDVGGTNIKIMLMDCEKTIIADHSIPTEKEKGRNSITDKIINIIIQMLTNNQVSRNRVACVCMGLPGAINIREQKTIHLAYLDWNNLNPTDEIGKFFNCPTLIDNDASLNAWGEYHFSHTEQYKNIVLLTLGTGVGCGVILNGEIFRGSSYLGAEIGHMTIDASSPELCLCGRAGHFEAFCSGKALARYTLDQLKRYPDSKVQRLSKEAGGNFNPIMIDRAALDGDWLACKIFARFNTYLSIGIANLVNIFNPELILIGGGLAAAKNIQIPAIKAAVIERILSPDQMCQIEKTKLGGKAGMYGACLKAMEHLEQVR